MMKLLALSLVILLGVPLAMLGGVVLADLWRWFVVPIFHLPAFTFMQAVGISYVVAFFRIGLAAEKVDTDDDAPIVGAFYQLGVHALGYLILWGLGAIWHLFV